VQKHKECSPSVLRARQTINLTAQVSTNLRTLSLTSSGQPASTNPELGQYSGIFGGQLWDALVGGDKAGFFVSIIENAKEISGLQPKNVKIKVQNSTKFYSLKLRKVDKENPKSVNV